MKGGWPPVEHACGECGAFPGERHAPACDTYRKLYESYTGLTVSKVSWHSQADDAKAMKKRLAASEYTWSPATMTAYATPILQTATVGLYGDVLVCDDQETEGDAPGKCRTCKGAVRIRNGHIPLFGGRDDPPEIQCMKCRQGVLDVENEKVIRVQDSHVHVGVDSGDLMDQLSKYAKVLEKTKDATKDADLFVSCVVCGASLKGGKGVVRCKKCQRRSWRRRKA